MSSLNRLRQPLQDFWVWLIESEGSTRVYALLRMGIVALVWTEWAEYFIGPHGYRPAQVVTAIGIDLFGFMTFIGLFTRLSSAVLATTVVGIYFYWGLYENVRDFPHHHSWLLMVFTVLLALAPSGQSYSVDRWLAIRRGPITPEQGPLWPLRLLAFQVAAVYFWGAYDKLEWPFMSGVRMQHHFYRYAWGSDEITWAGFPYLMHFVAVFTVIVEFALPVTLFIPRLRWPSIVFGILFHGILFHTLTVGPFSLTMILGYLAFLNPDDVHRTIDGISAPAKPAPDRLTGA